MLSSRIPQRGDRAAGLAPFCDALSILLALGSRPPLARRRRLPSRPADPPIPVETGQPTPLPHAEARLERILFQHNASLDSLDQDALATPQGVVKLPDWTTVARGRLTAADGRWTPSCTGPRRHRTQRRQLCCAARRRDRNRGFPSDPDLAGRDASWWRSHARAARSPDPLASQWASTSTSTSHGCRHGHDLSGRQRSAEPQPMGWRGRHREDPCSDDRAPHHCGIGDGV